MSEERARDYRVARRRVAVVVEWLGAISCGRLIRSLGRGGAYPFPGRRMDPQWHGMRVDGQSYLRRAARIRFQAALRRRG